MTDQSKEQSNTAAFPFPAGTVMRPVGTMTSSEPASRARMTVDLSPAALKVLEDLISQTRDTPSDVLRKALGLYKLAVDAHDQGQHIGASTSAEPLEIEFTGF
jgi:hypothetical protein